LVVLSCAFEKSKKKETNREHPPTERHTHTRNDDGPTDRRFPVRRRFPSVISKHNPSSALTKNPPANNQEEIDEKYKTTTTKALPFFQTSHYSNQFTELTVTTFFSFGPN